MALTEKQRKFVESYLVTNNAKQSAINAGYPEKTSAAVGWQLLKNHKILAEIDSCRTKLRSKITKESYIDKALETFEKLDITEPNAPRFYDIAGKALGYLGNNEQKTSQTLNITQINVSGNETQTELWELTRKLLGND